MVVSPDWDFEFAHVSTASPHAVVWLKPLDAGLSVGIQEADVYGFHCCPITTFEAEKAVDGSSAAREGADFYKFIQISCNGSFTDLELRRCVADYFSGLRCPNEGRKKRSPELTIV